MKFPIHYLRISLAAKVRLLFGAAVAMILAAALFVPWDRMSRLAREQDLAEAHRIATLHLLEICGRAGPSPPASMPDDGPARAARRGASYRTAAQTGPDSLASGDPTEDMEGLWAMMQVSSAAMDSREIDVTYIPLIGAAAATQPGSGFVARALKSFAQSPDDEYYYDYRRRQAPNIGADGKVAGVRRELRLQYVRALRVTESCDRCHLHGSARPFPANTQLAGAIHVSLPAARTDSEQFWNWFSVIGAGAVASILAVIVFYVVMKSLVLSPVRKLRRLADRIGEGELAIRSTIETGDEFEKLARAFNSMLERLQVGQQQMRQINESLNSKMSELNQANTALFEANRLKNEFLASVSHELRTPLNSIIGFAEVLRDQMNEQAAQSADPHCAKAARYAENIFTSGRMLLDLINDLLDLAKIEAGKVIVRSEKVAVGDLVQTVVNFMRPAAEKKNLRVEVRIDPELPLIETDAGKFQQILYNLFSNAVKFTPPRGLVTVAARLEPVGRGQAVGAGQGDPPSSPDLRIPTTAGPRQTGPEPGSVLQLSVIDTGPGIPPEDHQIIFERFHQRDRSTTREHGGTGLGLSISRELARMLGGEISLVSKVGEGSTFTLTLPLKPVSS